MCTKAPVSSPDSAESTQKYPEVVFIDPQLTHTIVPKPEIIGCPGPARPKNVDGVKQKKVQCFLSGPLQPITRLIVDLHVPDNAERFSINFHKDEKNILCHFDPRFNYGTCKNITVCNVMQNGEWGIEDCFGGDKHPFPFTPGGDYTVAFEFGENEIGILVNDKSYITFKCREKCSMQDITYLEFQFAEVYKVEAVKLLIPFILFSN
ncbi:16 kDa beta-galactoside-binding lectin-like [Ambystoma mexicanum]|uniref:16 kDa beta-galactoside-binding lectin-like n=1 Tax=Ambystoma mexicanum TaxID=8296 RepID=UPI0037E71233